MNIAVIEKQLSTVWEQMAASSAEGEQAVTRACVHNLIIYAPGPNSDTEISRMMADVTMENPGRIIVLLDAKEGSEPSAWVTAQCHLRSGGRKQVCCEEIMIRLTGEDLPNAPSIVRALLVPDVPVYIWWRSAPTPDTVFLDLLETADRIIVDSALLSGDEFSAIQTIGRLIEREGEWLSVSDINWARLTPWRTAIAELFDAPQNRGLLYDINKVTVVHDSSSVAKSQALLLPAWLGACLDWKPVGKTSNNTIDFQRENSAIQVEFQTVNANAGTLQRIEIVTASGGRVLIEDGASGHLRGIVWAPQQEELSEVIAAPSLSEAALLNRELEIIGRDVMYEKAIRLIRQLK